MPTLKRTLIFATLSFGLALVGKRALLAAEPAVPHLGANASLNGRRPFPEDDPWNRPVDDAPIDPKSDAILVRIGLNKPLHPDFGTVYRGAPMGIPYIVVDTNQTPVPIRFTAYGNESDPGPYPVPADAPIEGGPAADGDRHVLVIDRSAWKLYELDRAFPDPATGGWKADCGAVFDLSKSPDRPDHWTSADAAGLPIFAGLVRYDEVAEQKAILHALRFTVAKSRHAYVPPAKHFASRSTDPDLPPMGMRVRLKASVDISHYPPEAQVILTALKRYGMIVADNGSDWFLSGAPDPRWNDENLSTLKRIKGKDFEVVRMEGLVTK